METFSRGQQVVVLLIIFGMTLLYFHSINQPTSRQPAVSKFSIHPFTDSPKLATDHRPPTTENLSGAQRLTLNKPINLNTATKTDLEAIPGVGPKTAEKIVDYRKKHGRFEKIEDVMNIKGIKDKKFEKIKRYLAVK